MHKRFVTAPIKCLSYTYYLFISRGDALNSPLEPAGPLNDDTTSISSRLGNLCVHVNPLGLQIWYLGYTPSRLAGWKLRRPARHQSS